MSNTNDNPFLRRWRPTVAYRNYKIILAPNFRQANVYHYFQTDIQGLGCIMKFFRPNKNTEKFYQDQGTKIGIELT